MNIILIIILIILAAIANSFMDAIQFRNFGDGNLFWDKDTSWLNKYKDYLNGDKSAKFPFSKTALVFLTDGWHLMQFIMLSAFTLAIVIPIEDTFWMKFMYYWLFKIIFGGVFRLTFNKILTKKND